ncbi:MAG: hypothetical protein D6748_02305 [Calditrichaeota bacterium]|nr:MAG: hypothetical protein D6748_02305 [Calditrichota bacterium]
MKAFFLILNKEEYLEEILEVFLELNIPGATVIDSIGMGTILAKDIPIFAGFRHVFQGSRSGNKTIISIIPDELVEPTILAIEQVIGPLTSPGNGLAFTVAVQDLFGLREAL